MRAITQKKIDPLRCSVPHITFIHSSLEAYELQSAELIKSLHSPKFTLLRNQDKYIQFEIFEEFATLYDHYINAIITVILPQKYKSWEDNFREYYNVKNIIIEYDIREINNPCTNKSQIYPLPSQTHFLLYVYRRKYFQYIYKLIHMMAYIYGNPPNYTRKICFPTLPHHLLNNLRKNKKFFSHINWNALPNLLETYLSDTLPIENNEENVHYTPQNPIDVDISFIAGEPGSGKTHFIIDEIIKKMKNCHAEKFLICVPLTALREQWKARLFSAIDTIDTYQPYKETLKNNCRFICFVTLINEFNNNPSQYTGCTLILDEIITTFQQAETFHSPFFSESESKELTYTPPRKI